MEGETSDQVHREGKVKTCLEEEKVALGEDFQVKVQVKAVVGKHQCCTSGNKCYAKTQKQRTDRPHLGCHRIVRSCCTEDGTRHKLESTLLRTETRPGSSASRLFPGLVDPASQSKHHQSPLSRCKTL